MELARKNISVLIVFAAIVMVAVIFFADTKKNEEAERGPLATTRNDPTEQAQEAVDQKKTAVREVREFETKEDSLSMKLPSRPPHSLPDEAVVTFPNEAARMEFMEEARRRGWIIVAENRALNAIRLRLKSEQERRAVLEYANRSGGVADWNYQADAPPPVNFTVGKSGAFGANAYTFIGAPEAAERAQWGSGVTVAILDNGVIPSNELAGALRGEVDLTQGDIRAERGKRLLGHGTAVANLIGGERGLAPQATLNSYRVLNADGAGDSFTVALGIVQATDDGADIISLSLGTRADTALLRQAVAYAQAQGVLLVAAVGNEGSARPYYPAAYEGVIAVGGVDTGGQPAPFSNRGNHLALAAPAVGVQTAWTATDDVLFTGTSAAAPIVSGALAGLLSEDPTLTPAGAVGLLKAYANDTGAPGKDSQTGAGVIDLKRIRERNTPGIYDSALAGVWINPERSTETALDVVVSVQNRGTERLSNLRLEIKAENRPPLFFPVGNLAPGATGSQSFTIPVSDAAAGVRLQAAAVADNQQESNLENNKATLVLKPIRKNP